jgi:hypothetical protein
MELSPYFGTQLFRSFAALLLILVYEFGMQEVEIAYYLWMATPILF